MAVGNVQFELLSIKKLIESKNPELLTQLKLDLFSVPELHNMVKITGLLYSSTGELPGWDFLKAELTDRIINPEKQKFYLGLLEDIKNKDASGVSTEDLISKLKTQRQFRVILDGASKLVDAVDKKDADRSIGVMRELYQDMFQHDVSESFDSSDMVQMAGKSIMYDFQKTGFTGWDRYGGMIKGGLIGVAAAAKAGKTIMATQMMLHGYDTCEGSTLLYSYEMPAQEVRARILSFRSEVDVGLISADLLTPEDRLHIRESEVAHLCDFNATMKDFCQETRKLPEEEFWPLFWSHFSPRENRCYLPGKGPNWDELFIQMQLMVDMKNVKTIVIDYPALIGKGSYDRNLASWEYTLAKSRELKSFARDNGIRVITPMQYDDKNDNIRFASNVICDVDCLVTLKQEEGDQEYGDMGAVTVGFKAYRNYLSTPGFSGLQPFKLLKQFNYSKFLNFDF